MIWVPRTRTDDAERTDHDDSKNFTARRGTSNVYECNGRRVPCRSRRQNNDALDGRGRRTRERTIRKAGARARTSVENSSDKRKSAPADGTRASRTNERPRHGKNGSRRQTVHVGKWSKSDSHEWRYAVRLDDAVKAAYRSSSGGGGGGGGGGTGGGGGLGWVRRD